MNKYFKAFQIALSLLTIIPSHSRRDTTPADIYRQAHALSPIFYPLVAVLILAVLVMAMLLGGRLFHSFPALQSIWLVFVWVLITGAIHLDGLCDSVDAAFAAHREPDNTTRVLKILRDPCSGPMANIALFFVLAFKCVSLYYLSDSYPLNVSIWALSLGLLFARVSVALMPLFIPYARSQGLAATMSATGISKTICGALGLFYLASFLVLFFVYSPINWWIAFICVGVAICVCVCWSRLWLRLIGGYTGDTLGAQIELLEISMLLCILVFIK